MSLFSLVLLGAGLLPTAGEEHANPLFRELRETGVAVGADIKVPLPAPTMPDGLNAKAQLAVIKELAGNDYALEDLTRNSQVAPNILRIRDVKPSDPDAPAKGVDLWFIAYGDLKTFANKDFLDRLLSNNKKEGKGQALSSEDLGKRNITVKSDSEKHESYGRVVFDFLDKVEISATGRSYWSETADSILLAAHLDSRFTQDKEFPNQWRSLTKTGEGNPELGPPQPYDGAAYYMKITRLAEPPGALFIEAHEVFTEPVKWFDGANLLRSKLPAAVQSQVRTMRRELTKASSKPEK